MLVVSIIFTAMLKYFVQLETNTSLITIDVNQICWNSRTCALSKNRRLMIRVGSYLRTALPLLRWLYSLSHMYKACVGMHHAPQLHIACCAPYLQMRVRANNKLWTMVNFKPICQVASHGVDTLHELWMQVCLMLYAHKPNEGKQLLKMQPPPPKQDSEGVSHISHLQSCVPFAESTSHTSGVQRQAKLI